MDQAPPRFAPLTPALIRRPRRVLPFEPAVRAIAARPGFREDARLFGFTYLAGFVAFLTWLG